MGEFKASGLFVFFCLILSLILIGLVQPAHAFNCEGTSYTQGPGGDYKIPPDDKVLFQHGLHSERVFYRGEKIELFVWNIFKAKRPGLWTDLQNLGAKSDLLLLQEGIVNSDSRLQLELLKGRGWTTAISFTSENQSATGVTSGFKIKPKEECFIRSSAREPILATPKMALVSILPVLMGNDLLVVNIHGINFVSNKEFASQLIQVANVIREHEGPMIVAGDFNTHNKGRKDLLADFARILKLTWIPISKVGNGLDLDHILVREMRVLSAKKLTSVESSDHYPLIAQFELQ